MMTEVAPEAVRKKNRVLIPAYMAILMMGCGLGWLLNFVLEGDEVEATLFQCSLIASFGELGRIVFLIPAGVLLNKYGRRKTITRAALLSFLTGLALSLNYTSIIMMCAGRFLHRLGLALIDDSALITIGEIASPEVRAQSTVKSFIFSATGTVSTSIISVILSSYKVFTYGFTFFSVITLFLSMYLLIETPSFLISKLEQAKDLKHIRQTSQANEKDEEFEKLQKFINDEKTCKNQLNWIKFLKFKMIRKPLIIGTLLNFFTIFTGGAILMIYTTSIFPFNNFVPNQYYPLISQAVLLFSLTIPLWIDKFPRRVLFLLGAALMLIFNSICAMANYSLNESESEPIFQWVSTLGNILVRLCFPAILFPISNTFQSGLFSQIIRGVGGSLGILSYTLATIVVVQLYHYSEVH